MHMKKWTIGFAIILGAVAYGAASLDSWADDADKMTVWKSPWCGCCGKWVDHMKRAGFKVEVKETENMDSIKAMTGIPEKAHSCHTATVGGYLVEGHVPANDIHRLLREKPKGVKGLAVPGMPHGSPGMETGETHPYDVVTFDQDNKMSVFNSYR